MTVYARATCRSCGGGVDAGIPAGVKPGTLGTTRCGNCGNRVTVLAPRRRVRLLDPCTKCGKRHYDLSTGCMTTPDYVKPKPSWAETQETKLRGERV
jgi:hypothetical protein